MAVEAFLLNLLTYWQLVDEGAPSDDETLARTTNQLTEIRNQMTAEEIGAAHNMLLGWANNGDAWLRDYTERYFNELGLGVITTRVNA